MGAKTRLAKSLNVATFALFFVLFIKRANHTLCSLKIILNVWILRHKHKIVFLAIDLDL